MTKLLSAECTNAQTITHLFDHTIKPILLYASETWGTINTDLKRIKNNHNNILEKAYDKLKAEKVHLKMCRYILGVKPKTAITAIQGETGRFPLHLHITINIMKYLHHLSNSNSDLLKQALLCNHQLVQQNRPCWLSWAQAITHEAGLNLDIIKQPFGKWLPLAKKALKRRHANNWKLKLQTDQNNTNHGNKLRTYRKFKTCFQQEPYLNILTDKDLRKHYARLRTSSHTLHIETGRFIKTPPELRLCQLCESGEIEDETHFLTTCSLYKSERDKLFTYIENTCQNFTHLNPVNKLIWLFSAEQPDIVRSVAKFIRTCFNIRKLALNSTSTNHVAI